MCRRFSTKCNEINGGDGCAWDDTSGAGDYDVGPAAMLWVDAGVHGDDFSDARVGGDGALGRPFGDIVALLLL